MTRTGMILALTAILSMPCISVAENDGLVVSPTQAQQIADYQVYQADLVASLVRHGTARDFALAACASEMLDLSERLFGTGDGEPKNAADLYRQASAHGGDDALAHWLVANKGGDDEVSARSTEALKRIEPGNAAIWLRDLRSAWAARDDDAITVTLDHMAVADRFSVHYVEATKAWLESVDREPIPAELSSHAEVGRNASPLGIAVGFASAAGFPPFEDLVNVCKDAESRGDTARIARCATIAWTMISKSDALLSEAIGAAVLRQLGVSESAESGALKRERAWLQEQYLRMLTGEAEGPARIEDAYRRLASEREIVVEVLTLSRVVLLPPPGWEPGKR